MDITTSLQAALARAVDNTVDKIAADGLVLLNRVLIDAGFQKHENLKNYEVYSYVKGRVVEFEILLDIEGVTPEGAAAKKVLEDIAPGINDREADTGYAIKADNRSTYKMHDARRDARTPARDARKSSHDNRKTSRARAVDHEIAMRAPRSGSIDRTGKLSVTLQKAVRSTETGVEMPKPQFDGLIGAFYKELGTLISNVFVPELTKLMVRELE